jgi:hypothetical protein
MKNNGGVYRLDKVNQSDVQIHAQAAGDIVVDPDRFNDEMSFQNFFTLVAGCIAAKGRSLPEVYPSCPSIVHLFFPFKLAVKKYDAFLAKEFIEGDVSSKISAPILQALYFGKPLDPVVKKENIPVVLAKVVTEEKNNPDKISTEDFRSQMEFFKGKKRIALPKIWELLPEEIKSKYCSSTIRNYLVPSNSIKSVSSEIHNMIVGLYQKFPDWDQPVLSDEVENPFPFEKQLRSMVSINITQSQIRKARDKHGIKWDGIAPMFAECIGVDLNEAKELLGIPGGRSIVRPRMRVAIILALIEGKTVPQEAIDLHNRYLEKKSSHVNVSKIRSQLPRIFESVDLSPEIIYSHMPDDYRTPENLGQIKGWFNGSVTQSCKTLVAAFLKSTAKVLEAQSVEIHQSLSPRVQ